MNLNVSSSKRVVALCPQANATGSACCRWRQLKPTHWQGCSS
jgi:hypothetical protein